LYFSAKLVILKYNKQTNTQPKPVINILASIFRLGGGNFHLLTPAFGKSNLFSLSEGYL
jgi:hypothetical protein